MNVGPSSSITMSYKSRACHGRPRRSAGVGVWVATGPLGMACTVMRDGATMIKTINRTFTFYFILHLLTQMSSLLLSSCEEHSTRSSIFLISAPFFSTRPSIFLPHGCGIPFHHIYWHEIASNSSIMKCSSNLFPYVFVGIWDSVSIFQYWGKTKAGSAWPNLKAMIGHDLP